jgi:hypothetical protein
MGTAEIKLTSVGGGAGANWGRGDWRRRGIAPLEVLPPASPAGISRWRDAAAAAAAWSLRGAGPGCCSLGRGGVRGGWVLASLPPSLAPSCSSRASAISAWAVSLFFPLAGWFFLSAVELDLIEQK